MASEDEQNFQERRLVRIKQLLSVLDHRGRDAPVKQCLKDLYPRLSSSPASVNDQYYSAYSGGLIDHTLSVVDAALTMRCGFNETIPEDSVVRAGLLHDIGKVGDDMAPHFLPVTSDWQRARGFLFEPNPDIVMLPVHMRTAFWLARYGVQLTSEEWQAVCYAGTWGLPSWSDIQYRETPLTMLLASAKSWVMHAARKPRVRT